MLEAPTTGAEDWKDGADALAFPRTRLRIDKEVFSLSRDLAIRIRIVPSMVGRVKVPTLVNSNPH